MSDKLKPDTLKAALADFRGALILVFVISGVVNALALTGAFYMLQIYDRALTSQSIPTLVALSVLAIGLYFFQGALDVIRSQVLVRLGARLDKRLSPLAHRVAVDMPRYGFSTTESIERSRDVDTLRHFFSGQGPIALLDLPWMPLYLIFVYSLHPTLGMATIGGAIVLTALTFATELRTRGISAETQKAATARAVIADSNARNAEVLKAMGFAGRAIERYQEANSRHLNLQTRANDIGGTFSGISKVLRMILQSAILGLGALLVIQGELTAGAIIAASVASARALAPVDMAIGQWKNVVAARRAHKRLGETLNVIPETAGFVTLPDPSRSLKLEKMTVATPNSGTIVLSEVAFELTAGSALGLVGPSGSGKSSLTRAITGIWPLVRGNVRLDDADITQWPADSLGSHIGYLPQEVSLLDGTIAENISRFEREAPSELIIKAATAAGVHEMIVRLTEGYQTRLGAGGTSLSAGQRQRLALARALYRDPFLVVLDEPNSNLDAEGDTALTVAIKNIRARGGIVIVVAHRPSALLAVDLVGVIQNGRLVAFGPKNEIIQDSIRPAPVTPAHAPSTPGVKSPAATGMPASAKGSSGAASPGSSAPATASAPIATTMIATQATASQETDPSVPAQSIPDKEGAPWSRQAI